MLNDFKKGFGLMLGAMFAAAVAQCVGEMVGVKPKPKESNENPEKKEEA